ncbi:MAG TPA: ABC transporter ATP-binding protein [Steroidobacteraceae bacterium]|nr:ABC transporter ATP-binding protein [Steroidobacteraceae bacterium]
MTARAFIEFRDVSKTYDGRMLAVAGLSCSVERGEFLTFLGPSGSGKTTALMMLAGFEQPSAGDIRLNGRSLENVPPHRRNMGVVFQNYALFPHMSVAENVAFALRVRHVAAATVRERVHQALALVRLEGYEDRRPSQLSGGQQQRVALARALVFGPDLILMDEPLGALDKQLREQLQVEIKQIQRHLGVTVVYVTHDQSEALTLSDRIALFADGSIQQIGTPEELYEAPASAFVAQFIGQNNRIDGVVDRVEGEHCVIRLPDGAAVRAKRQEIAASAGTRVCAWVRPEHLQLGATTLANSLDCRVQEVVYQGDHLRVRLALPFGAELVAKCSRSQSACLPRGASATVAFAAENCMAFDENAGEAR